MASFEQLEQEIIAIKERNSRVQLNKAWETSYTRRLLLTIFTYLAVAVYFNAIAIENPWRHAIVPALAFMLSTLTLPFFKKIWAEKIHKN